MKNITTRYNREQISLGLFGIFIFITLFTGLYSEVFHKSEDQIDLTQIYTNPFSAIYLKTVNTIELKNRMGEYKLHKDENRWSLTSPRKLFARESKIISMLESLEKITIKKIYSKDEININNFSLHEPLAQITLNSELDNYKVKVGLINPINQTAFISFDHLDKIFQIAVIEFPFESTVFSELIDARVFNFNLDDLNQLEIFRAKQTKPFFKIKRVGQNWLDSKSRNLDKEKVYSYLTRLVSLKSSIILDQVSKEANKLLENAFKYQQYRVRYQIYDEFKNVKISSILYRTDALKIEKKKYFSAQGDGLQFPHVLSKDYLSIFNQRESKFREK